MTLVSLRKTLLLSDTSNKDTASNSAIEPAADGDEAHHDAGTN